MKILKITLPELKTAYQWFAGVIVIILMTACTAPAPLPETTGPPPSVPSIKVRLPLIRFTIQVGAFSTSGRAATYAVYLRSAGLDAYYFVDGDGFSKVRFERFRTKDAARRRARNLRSKGIIDTFYIVQPVPSTYWADPETTLRKGLVKTARRFKGIPYSWGGASEKTGFDCSGLTMTVYRLNGLELPRHSAAQFRAGTAIKRSALKEGDLVFFATGRGSRISHVGIYSGHGQFIHAPGRGKRIRTASLSNVYFKKRFKGACRYF